MNRLRIESLDLKQGMAYLIGVVPGKPHLVIRSCLTSMVGVFSRKMKSGELDTL